jgi:hypothetical protein
VDEALLRQVLADELAALGGADRRRLGDAAALLEKLVLGDDFSDFLTIPAYRVLDAD